MWMSGVEECVCVVHCSLCRVRVVCVSGVHTDLRGYHLLGVIAEIVRVPPTIVYKSKSLRHPDITKTKDRLSYRIRILIWMASLINVSKGKTNIC